MPPSVTNWWRLEARARDPDLAGALEARVADPLWMLGRQWQTGEFQGTDGGTPVNARARLSVRTLGWYRPGGTGAGQPLDLASAPLEQVVEAEPAPRDLRQAIAGGRHWLRLLGAGAGVLANWLKEYALDPGESGPAPDPDAERLAAAAGGRVLDGRAVYDAVVEATEAGDFGDLPGSAQAIEKAAPAYIAWWEAHAGARGAAPAWQDARMEYEFGIATSSGDETVFTARDYGGDGIDWPAFDVGSGSLRGPAAAPAADKVVAVALPSPVAFKGMPLPRWWEFEDATVSFPRIDAAPDDLARLFAAEFALIYGNDFFAVPVRLPVGTVSRVDSLVVEDSFGWSFLIESTEAVDGAGSPWHVFKVTVDGRGPAGDPLRRVAAACHDRRPHRRRADRGRPPRARRRRGARVGDRARRPGRRAAGRSTGRRPRPSDGGAKSSPPRIRHPRRRASSAITWPPRCPRTGTRCCPGRRDCGRSTSRSARRTWARTRRRRRSAPCSGAGAAADRGGGAAPRRAAGPQAGSPRPLERRLRAPVWLGRRTGPGRGESGSGLRFDSADSE